MKIVAFLALVIVLEQTFNTRIFSKNTSYIEAAVQTCSLKNVFLKILQNFQESTCPGQSCRP